MGKFLNGLVLNEGRLNDQYSDHYYFLLIFTLIWIKWVPGDPITSFLATMFTQKMPESSGSMYSSILMLENIRSHHFTWSEPNSNELWFFFQFSLGPWGPTIATKFINSCGFGPLQVKWWFHMFSNMKKKEYMESDISSIFRVKMVATNILFGSLVTQRQAVFAIWCLSLKKHT